jgi:hypothetical protein
MAHPPPADPLEAAFAAALLDRGAPVPAGVLATPRRFAVYRDNVAAALTAALAARFPLLRRIVGDAFFRALALGHAKAHPPRRACLLDYGDTLPAFLGAFAPAADLPYLPDIARLEIARSQAYHAADAPVVTAGDLEAIGPERLATARIRPHPAARLLASPHPIATIAAMHAPGAEPGPIEPWQGEAVLLTRPGLTVRMTVLSEEHHGFHEVLLAGGTLGEAALAAMLRNPAFDPASALAGLITTGAVRGFLEGDRP